MKAEARLWRRFRFVIVGGFDVLDEVLGGVAAAMSPTPDSSSSASRLPSRVPAMKNNAVTRFTVGIRGWSR